MKQWIIIMGYVPILKNTKNLKKRDKRVLAWYKKMLWGCDMFYKRKGCVETIISFPSKYLRNGIFTMGGFDAGVPYGLM